MPTSKKTTQTRTLPLVVIQSTGLLPGMLIHFDLPDDDRMKSVNHAMENSRLIFITNRIKPAEEKDLTETPEELKQNIYSSGTICKIRQLIKVPGNITRVIISSLSRASIRRLSYHGYMTAAISCKSSEPDISPVENEAMRRDLLELLANYGVIYPKIAAAFDEELSTIKDIGELSDRIAGNVPLEFDQRQALLETAEPAHRFLLLRSYLSNEIEIAAFRSALSDKFHDKLDKEQRDYMLRQQIHYIQEELGEEDPQGDAEKYMASLSELKASEEVKNRISREIARFKNIPPGSSESGVAQMYIETLLAMPWDRKDKENTSLENASAVLERDHYGMEKVKERMLEFLAVRNLTEKGQSPIICLIGPPGTGKTSIARSVAEALGRKYIRISLGGVRDEAEIRGHRRTYVGAMSGCIASGLERAGASNPLILLDEIDKLSSEYRGAVSSALLEVLDSEQNSQFRDHYIDIPVDLSDVLFIATANSRSEIPEPLLDRMEVVEVPGYTENEKFHIAKEHLEEKQKSKNGLKKSQLYISDEAMHKVIISYTREAGVRALERRIGEICRKAARKICGGGSKKLKVGLKNLQDYLGVEKYPPEEQAGEDSVGIVRGLAWTSVGGVTLEIEVNTMPGKGDLLLTGQLGDVMKESGRAALSYVRSVSDLIGVDEKYFRTHDFHVHIPEGATPKDGPSAGVTMAAALFSAVSSIKVKGSVAMTGEVTLRGRVLPIGGLREKILAARMAGITTCLIPEKNRRDLDEISPEIKDGINIKFASTMEDILDTALVGGLPRHHIHRNPDEGGTSEGTNVKKETTEERTTERIAAEETSAEGEITEREITEGETAEKGTTEKSTAEKGTTERETTENRGQDK